MRKIQSALVTLSLVAGAALSASAQAPDTWQSGFNSSSTSMRSGGGCSNGTYIYYVNGYGAQTQRYDPTANSWLDITAPTAGSGGEVTAAYAGGYVYCFGNRDTGSSNVSRLNTTTNTWQDQAPLANHTWSVVPCGAGNFIYLFGGGSGSTACSRYDTATGTETAMATCPTSFTNFNSLWTMGAYDPYAGVCYLMNTTTLYSFTPPAGAGLGTWSAALAPCPVSKRQGTLFTGKGRVFALQGTRLDQYFIGNNQWTLRATCPASFSRAYGRSAQLNATTAYAFGGQGAWQQIYKYNLPAFGNPPADATTVEQFGSLGITLQAGANPNLGWTDRQITLRGTVTDTDLDALGQPEQVAFEARCKLSSDPTWNNAVTATSGLGAQGVRSAVFNIPSGGDWDWQYHTVDANFNYTPNVGGIPSWYDFNKNAVTPDFRSDQQNPTVPSGIYPDMYDITVPSLVNGDINFQWTLSTDNGPASAIRYSIQVAHNDSAFGVITASQAGIVPTNTTINLATSRYNYYYRVGATDIGGNFSGWSATKYFRVFGDDGQNHSAGDAARVCGFSTPGSSYAMAIGIALLAMSLLFRRK